jgi:outer membrane receptor protein involved in Fe transport
MPRFALVNNINESQTIKFLYGQAYRAPSLGDMYDEESGLTIGSQDLKASEMNTTEFVYLHSFNQSQLTVTFFSNKQTNIIGRRTEANGNQALANIAKNKVLGIELEIIWQPIDSFRLVSSATHLSKNKTQLDRLSELPKSENISPDNLMSFSAYYQYGDWSFNINGNWRSKVKVLSSGSLWLLNSHIEKHLTNKLSLSLTLSNLFNTNYTTSSHTSLGVDENNLEVQKFPARGRQAMLKVSYKF